MGATTCFDYMKKAMAFLAICVALAPRVASGSDYYVNSADGSDDNSGAIAAPWKSIAKISGYAFKPGDSVRFARGSQFTGGFVISSSGQAGAPITFATYGTAAAPPRFMNSDPTALNGNVIQIRGSYVVVDGFYFHDCAAVPGSGGMQQFGAAPVAAGDPQASGVVFIAAGANNNVVRNTEITGSAVGIRVHGQRNLITRNFIHDNSAPAAPYGGPVGIAVGNSSNEISYNRIVDNGAASSDNESIAVVLEDRRYPKDDVRIHHNYSLRNGRFLEAVARMSESRRAAGGNAAFSFKNLTVSYNVSDEFGSFFRLSVPEMSGGRLENNTIVLTRGGTEAGPPRSAMDSGLLGRGMPAMLTYRNNILTRQ